MRYAYIVVALGTLAVLIRKRFYREFPAFCGYLALSVLAAIAYAWGFEPKPNPEWWLWHWVLWQPFLMIALALVLCELAWRASLRVYPAEMRLLVGLVIWLSVAAVFIVYRSIPTGASVVQVMGEIRRYYDLVAAISLSSACGWFLVRPLDITENARRHASILSWFLLVNAFTGLMEVTSASRWMQWDTVAYALSMACLLAWAIAALPVRRPIRA